MVKINARQQSLKKELEQKTMSFSGLDKRATGINRVNKAKAEMDISEVQHYEANLLYNIVIINMAYNTMPKFQEERSRNYYESLRLFSQQKIVCENEMHGFFKFVLNFYQNDP
jgi:hypothetical protein